MKWKDFQQMLTRIGMSYDQNVPDIRQQIDSWLTAEISYLEKKKQLFTVSNTQRNDSIPKDKIHTSLAVSQLSFGLKLLIDSGIIINHNYTDLTKLVAQNFRTDRIEKISEDSLRNKSYNIEKVTADKMRDVVVNLLNLVRKY